MATLEEIIKGKTMNTIYIDKHICIEQPCVATIGFFDGVHKGHQFLIQHVIEKARKQNMLSMVITFNKHPREVLHAEYQPQLLNTLEEKEHLLSKTGVDICAVLPFSMEMASLSAYGFMSEILKKLLHIEILYIGYDNRFGHNRNETYNDYVRYGKELGIEVIQNEELIVQSQQKSSLSSSLIRRLLTHGDVDKAAMLLGYHYFFQGTVVDGVHKGRELGFPTANIIVNDSHKLIVASGVYAVKVYLLPNAEPFYSMMNIGTRPTFGENEQTLEVHLLNYSGDLYGKEIKVEFVGKLREERKFDNEEMLRQQLKKDALMAVSILEESERKQVTQSNNNKNET